MTPATLYPLAVGNQWVFTATLTGPNVPCPDTEVTVTIPNTEMAGGKNAFVVYTSCFHASADLSSNGGNVELYTTTWSPTLASPVQEGYSWKWTTMTFTWHDAGTVTVPAGTFSNCWTRASDDPTFEVATFCNHVGPVRYVAPDWKWELESYVVK